LASNNGCPGFSLNLLVDGTESIILIAKKYFFLIYAMALSLRKVLCRTLTMLPANETMAYTSEFLMSRFLISGHAFCFSVFRPTTAFVPFV